MNSMITPDLLREWGACYSDERILELFDGRESATLLDVLLSDIPTKDRVWVASCALGERDARLFACWCAEQVLPDDCDPRSRAAVDTARRFAYGKATREGLRAAWVAAEAAAWEAAESAATLAARNAAWNATWEAAYDAARKAAWAATWDAVARRLVLHVTGEEPLV
jgi:hypothetical protein